MADDLDKKLRDIGDAGRDAKADIDNLKQSVESLTRSLSSALPFTNDLASILGKSARQGEILAEQAAKVANNTSSTKELMNEAAKAQARQRTLSQKAAEATRQAALSSGQQQRIYQAMASQLSNAANEAGQLVNAFEELAYINAGLDKKVKFFETLSKTISKIPGFERLGYTLNEIGEKLRTATVKGKDGMAKLEIVLNGLGKAAAGVFAQQAMIVDQEITNMQKSLNLSRVEATQLKDQFAGIALNSEDIAVNSIRIAKANTELNNQLGTAVVFSGEMLVTFSKLTEVVGLSAEAAGSLAFQAQRSGESFRNVEESALEASYALQRSTGVALNNKEILEATGKITGQVRANLRANPAAIARAVTQAKLLGAEMDDILATQKSLLEFESSIENELKAELLTGKQLNLERARSLALAGDQEGLAAEIAAQAGSFTEFSKLNVLQQQELAAAFGYSADRMADILFKQEAQGMNARQLRAIGKGELADRLEQLSLQEKLNLASEKFMTMMGDLTTVLMPILDIFGGIVSAIAESKGLMAGLTAVMAGLATRSIVTAIASIFGASAAAGPIIGTIAAVAGVAALMSALGKGRAAARMAEGGIIPATPGGVPIIAGEAGRSEAIIPLNRLNQQQPTPPQPVIVEGNFSNFKSSNYNQMAYTQMRQMNDGVLI